MNRQYSAYVICLTAILAALVSLTMACNSTGNAVPTDIAAGITDIPALKIREGMLAQADDWAIVQTEVAQLREKIAKNPQDYKSMLYLAAIYMQEARTTGEHPYYYPAALQILDGILAQKPKDPDIQLQTLTSKASVCLSQHDFKQALALGQEALALNDKFAAVYGVLVDANVELGNYADAVKMSDKMSAMRPDLRSYSRVSYLRELHGDYEGALAAMRLAVEAGVPGAENTEWCRFTLGELYRRHKDLKNAELQYNMSLQLRPSYAFAQNGLAEIALARGEYDRALTLSEQAAAVMPEFSFYETQARVYQAQNQPEKVKSLTSDLLDMLSEDRESGHNVDLEIAKIHLHLGNDAQKAKILAASEYAKRPENISINELMAQIALAQQDKVAAKNYLAKATRTGYQSSETLELQKQLSDN